MKNIIQISLGLVLALFTVRPLSSDADRSQKVYKVSTDNKKNWEDLSNMNFDFWELRNFSQSATIPLTQEQALKLKKKYQLILNSELTENLSLVNFLKSQTGSDSTRHSEFSKKFECYRTVEEIYQSLNALALENPDFVTLGDIGSSWRDSTGRENGHPIRLIRITDFHSAVKNKPVLFIDAAIHAREMTTAELALRFAELIVSEAQSDSMLKNLLGKIELHIVPLSNPDGRLAADQRKLKRKNERIFENKNCRGSSNGVDLNRNYASETWGSTEGSSASHCNETYHGASAASEPETKAISNYLKSLNSIENPDRPFDFIYLSLHSYGGYLLPPDSKIENSAQQKILDRTQKMAERFGDFNSYRVCQPRECLYAAHGTSVDWAFETLRAPALTFELGKAFFESCSSFEEKVLPDNLKALRAALDELKLQN